MSVKDTFNYLIDSRIQNLEALREKVEHLPEIECAKAVLGSTGNFTLRIPYNFELVQQARQELKEQGWIKSHEGGPYLTTYGDAYSFVIFYKKIGDLRIQLDLDMDSGQDGSSCHIRKIGKEVREEEIIEVVCSEGAQENW